MSEQYQPSPKKNNGKKANRLCLKCRTEFLSSGPGNRVCHGCKSSNSGQRLPNHVKNGDGRVVRGHIKGSQ